MAEKKFYIADMHLGHKNVLRFDGRPFPNTEYMTEVMVNRWNACVTAEDTVYILGDMFWLGEKESVEIMRRLNGHKILVKGNHDRVHGRLRFQFDEIVDYKEINDGGRLVIMSHFPMPFYKNQYYGSIMLYGHVHNSSEWKLIEQFKNVQWSKGIPCRMINVGCMMDCMDYTPRTLVELLAANPFPVE